MGSVTKKARYRELFGEHFTKTREKARKETALWKGKFDNQNEKYKHAEKKFLDVTEFVEINMQTAIRISYDHTKGMDENLKEYKDQKARQDESDQVNFLRQPASGEATDEAHK